MHLNFVSQKRKSFPSRTNYSIENKMRYKINSKRVGKKTDRDQELVT